MISVNLKARGVHCIAEEGRRVAVSEVVGWGEGRTSTSVDDMLNPSVHGLI